MTEETVGDRIVRIALTNPELAGLTKAALAHHFGVSYETLRRWESGHAAPSRRRAEHLALVLGVREETFMHGVTYAASPARDSAVQELGGTSGSSQAQPMSFEPVIFPPLPRLQTVDWGDKEMVRVLQRFCVITPDDAMAPVIPKGTKVIFDSTLTPRSEDIVLVEDMSGDWHIRHYVQAPGARWEARPEKATFASLQSERDGLLVVAVFDGMLGRRG